MTSKRIVLLAAAVVVIATPALAAKPMSDRERKRAEAEHLCYDDVQKLCHEEIPNEDKIAACMKARRAELSPACGKVFDTGLN